MSTEENKRRRSVRLRGFDYAYRGFFFITICTHNKKSTLGKIINNEFRPSAPGKVVEHCWREIPEHFPNVYLDEWVIMPNHLHGIIVIRYPKGYDIVRQARHAVPLQS
jgi:REP-associated tyrosine transposase